MLDEYIHICRVLRFTFPGGVMVAQRILIPLVGVRVSAGERIASYKAVWSFFVP